MFRPVGRCVLRRIGQDRLLVPVSGAIARTNAVFPLNETAAFIWEQVVEGKSVDQIAQVITTRFEVTLEQALEDTRSCLAMLVTEGLLEEVSHESA